MGVPDSILSKPGKLTDDEWVAMRRHPEIAVDMLKDVHFLQTAMNIPHYHHERWNGTGYPQGLAGTDIPLSARLFSIVDVYDALTNVRPYRGPMPTAEALRYIQSQSGTHFDPDVVAAFLRMMHAQSEKVLLQKIV
jgi:HD-GYP domain-containing protein (c-di-GMP phosphodiesterase class II)